MDKNMKNTLSARFCSRTSSFRSMKRRSSLAYRTSSTGDRVLGLKSPFMVCNWVVINFGGVGWSLFFLKATNSGGGGGGNGEMRTGKEKKGASFCTGFVGHCRNEVFVTNIAKRNRLWQRWRVKFSIQIPTD